MLLPNRQVSQAIAIRTDLGVRLKTNWPKTEATVAGCCTAKPSFEESHRCIAGDYCTAERYKDVKAAHIYFAPSSLLF
jgi:hypothetical protein